MKKTKRHCFSCDLKDNPKLIEEYKNYHAEGNVWPEVIKSIEDAGIINQQIFLTGNRMFMIIDVDESFEPERKDKMNTADPKVQEWEDLMWNYQQALPWAEKGQKWVPMEKVFQL